MVEGSLPGPIFIAHSSDDKDFVRRLNADLAAAGFETWLDEKEMVVGDALPAKISSGLAEASAVIIVISPASQKSRWLHFELQIAIGRMVKGLRVLPVLLEDAEIPPELRALLYADFRKDYDLGLNAILDSLDQLRSIHAATAEPQRRWFYKDVRDRLHEVFDSVGSASLMGEYRSLDFNVAGIECPEGREVEVVYDQVQHYGERQKPISLQFWREFLDVMEEVLDVYVMLISQRPLDLPLQRLDSEESRVLVQYDDSGAPSRQRGAGDYWRVAFAVDFSGELDENEQRGLLRLVREHIEVLETKRRQAAQSPED